MSTPRSIRSRASDRKLDVFGSHVSSSPVRQPCVRLEATAVDDAHDVGLLHDQEFLAVDLDLGARPLAEQDAVAGLDVERDELAVLVAGARADGDDLAFLRLFLGGVGNDDAALGLLFLLDALTTTRSCRGRNFIVAPPRKPGISPCARLLALSPDERQPPSPAASACQGRRAQRHYVRVHSGGFRSVPEPQKEFNGIRDAVLNRPFDHAALRSSVTISVWRFASRGHSAIWLDPILA